MSIGLSVSVSLSVFSSCVLPVRAVGHNDLLRREQEPRIFNSLANLERNVKDGKSRAVFFAGVEGSGHHFLGSVLSELGKTSKTPLPIKQVFTGIQWDDVCKLHADNTQAYDKVDFSGIDGVATLYPIWSYPCFFGSHEDRKLKQHPRLDLLKAKAVEANVDFHVLLMYRPLEECLVADCEHRVIEDCEHQADTLASNARFLIDQVRKSFPDRGQVHCWSFGQIDSMKAAMNQAYGENGGWSDDVINNLFQQYKSRSHSQDNGTKENAYEHGQTNQSGVDQQSWQWDWVGETEVVRVPDNLKKILAQPDAELKELCR